MDVVKNKFYKTVSMKKFIIITLFLVTFCFIAKAQDFATIVGRYIITDSNYLEIAPKPIYGSTFTYPIEIIKSPRYPNEIYLLGLIPQTHDTVIGKITGNTFQLSASFITGSTGVFGNNAISYIYYSSLGEIGPVEGHCTGIKEGTGIADLEANKELNYRNPLKDGDVICFSKKLIGSSFSLYTMDGRLVYIGIIQSDIMNIANYIPANDIYFYTVMNNKQTFLSGKIVNQ